MRSVQWEGNSIPASQLELLGDILLLLFVVVVVVVVVVVLRVCKQAGGCF